MSFLWVTVQNEFLLQQPDTKGAFWTIFEFLNMAFVPKELRLTVLGKNENDGRGGFCLT